MIGFATQEEFVLPLAYLNGESVNEVNSYLADLEIFDMFLRLL